MSSTPIQTPVRGASLEFTFCFTSSSIRPPSPSVRREPASDVPLPRKSGHYGGTRTGVGLVDLFLLLLRLSDWDVFDGLKLPLGLQLKLFNVDTQQEPSASFLFQYFPKFCFILPSHFYNFVFSTTGKLVVYPAVTGKGSSCHQCILQ
jgi:hypothetical protein